MPAAGAGGEFSGDPGTWGLEQPLKVPGLIVWGRELVVDEGTDPSATGDVVTWVQRLQLSATTSSIQLPWGP